LFNLLTKKILVPDPPAIVKVVPHSSSSVIVLWKQNEAKNPENVRFILYKRFRPSPSSTEVKIISLNVKMGQNHRLIKNLKMGVFYQFWVTAKNEFGEGEKSQVEGFRGGTIERGAFI